MLYLECFGFHAGFTEGVITLYSPLESCLCSDYFEVFLRIPGRYAHCIICIKQSLSVTDLSVQHNTHSLIRSKGSSGKSGKNEKQCSFQLL